MIAGKSATVNPLVGELTARQRSKTSPDVEPQPDKNDNVAMPIVAKDAVAKEQGAESSGSSDFEFVHASDVANNNDPAATAEAGQKASVAPCPKATMDEDDDDVVPV